MIRVSGVVAALCLTITVTFVVLAPVAAAAAAAAEPACTRPPTQTGEIEEVPWAQDLYDAPEKIWPFSTGAGITVAVIDSGVDSGHPQLGGQVLKGYDYLRNTAEADVDCLPHGTAVASIIAAERLPGIGFFGLAPHVVILPVRITDKVRLNPQSEPLDPATLAAGINYAVDQGADVLNVSVAVYGPDPRVAQAVSRALSRGVVVVAAVGNGHSTQRDGNGPTEPVLTPYPAAYDGVIGVGAVEQDGQRVTTSQVGPYVDLVAPGGKITAAGVVGQNVYDGTDFASAFVSASAALLLAKRPSMLGPAAGEALPAAVSKRLLATASPAAGGPSSLAYGHGLVDPYRALTERTTGVDPSAVPGQDPPPRDPAAEQLAAERRSANGGAVLLGAAVVALVLVVIAAVVFLPRGRRRRWRAGRAVEAPAGNDEGPEFLPGQALFQAAPDPSDAARPPSRSE